MKAKQDKTSGRPVVVTTAHRGVFFGYFEKGSIKDGITLKKARLCVSWSRVLHGFMGLASKGPNSECRIGPPADIELANVTSVVECTPEAAEAWEKAPWA